MVKYIPVHVKSLPSRERGLKWVCDDVTAVHLRVACFAGARIEITSIIHVTPPQNVAPLRGSEE